MPGTLTFSKESTLVGGECRLAGNEYPHAFERLAGFVEHGAGNARGDVGRGGKRVRAGTRNFRAGRTGGNGFGIFFATAQQGDGTQQDGTEQPLPGKGKCIGFQVGSGLGGDDKTAHPIRPGGGMGLAESDAQGSRPAGIPAMVGQYARQAPGLRTGRENGGGVDVWFDQVPGGT